MAQYAFILYGSYKNPYLRAVRITDGLVFDVTAGQLAQAPAWGDTVISLGAKNAPVNGWPVNLPDLPAGAYDLQLYDSAAPSEADAMIAGWRLVMPHKLVVDPTGFPVDVFGRIRTTGA
jgi:nitrogen fixation protein